MIDSQPGATDDPARQVLPVEDEHPRLTEEAKSKKAKKAADDSEKAFEKAEKLAERWEKQQDRLAKLHLDGDKLMLRWLRTGLILVTTGIAIERGLTYFEQSRTGPSLDPYAVLRTVSLGLVLIGLVALGVACIQHRQRLQAIRLGDPPPVASFSLSLWVSVAVAALGVVAFLAAVVSSGSGHPLIR